MDCGNIRPLDEAQMCTVTDYVFRLRDLINTDDTFITELATAGCITLAQRDHIGDVQRSDRHAKLLEFLCRRSVADFNKFISVRNKRLRHLVSLFPSDGGETFWESL